MINLYHFVFFLFWTSRLSLASYPYYYHHPNLFQPNNDFDVFGFTPSVVNPYYQQIPSRLNTNQVYQIIYLQPQQPFDVLPPEPSYFEGTNGQQSEINNSTEEEELNYVIDARRENLTPTLVKSVTNTNEEYTGFTYRTQYQGGGHSNVVFYTGKGSHKLMFPSSQRQDKSLSDVASPARTIASDSLDLVNSSQENGIVNVTSTSSVLGNDPVPELASKNAISSTTPSEKVSSTTTEATITTTNTLEEFSAEEINLTTEKTTKTESISTENSLNATSTTLSSIK